MFEVISPFQHFYDLDGTPLSNGYIYIGTAGLNPETSPIIVYWDSAGTLPAAQPIRTVNGYPSRSGSPAKIYTSVQNFSITTKNIRGELVTSSLGSSSIGPTIPYVDNYAALRLVNPSLISAVYVLGGTTRDDGGQRTFISFTGAAPGTYTDNGGTIIVPTGGDGSAAWLGASDWYVTPEMFGAGGAGITNDVAALQTAQAVCLASGSTLCGDGTYRLDSILDLRFIKMDMANAIFSINHAGVGIRIGGNASTPNNPNQYIGTVTRAAGVSATPTMRATGVKGQNIHVEECDYLQVYADTEATERDFSYSCAYSNFYLKKVDKLELQSNPANAGGPPNSGIGGTVQWINENNFYLNRTSTLILDGTYLHNHNRFYAGTFESNATININYGRENRIYGTRFESQGGTTTITFGTNAVRNIILNVYDESEFNPDTPDSPLTSGTITDNGTSNAVIDDFRTWYNTETVVLADTSDVVFGNEVGVTAARLPYLQCIQGNSFATLVESDYLPVRVGEYYRWESEGAESTDTVRYRTFIAFYDKNLNPIVPLSTWIVSPNMSTITSNSIQQSAGVSSGIARITSIATSSGAMFCKVGWRASGGELSNGLARKLYVRHSTIEPPMNVFQNSNGRQYHVQLVTASPTSGFAPLGYTVAKSDATARYLCTFSLSTTSTANALLGATAVVLTTVTGILAGDIIGVNQDDRTTLWTTVVSVVGSTVNITAPLTAPSAIGSRVVVVRWRTEVT